MIGPNLPEDHVEPCNLMDKGSGVDYCLLSGETKKQVRNVCSSKYIKFWLVIRLCSGCIGRSLLENWL